jgi:hypothetical protein
MEVLMAVRVGMIFLRKMIGEIMKTMAIMVLLVSSSVLALQVSDSGTICETKTSATSELFNHCKEGDLIQVSSFGMKYLCKLNATIIPVQNEYLCSYRGSKRKTRKRPLSDAEKEVKNEYFERRYGVKNIHIETVK